MRRRATASLALLAASCGRYADFSLPPPPADQPARSFRWSARAEPVLGRDRARDVLNPSVVKKDGVYYNFYSLFDGAVWHTELATSADGVTWEKGGRILSPDAATWEGRYIAANGAALWSGHEWVYWYQAGPREQPRIGLARSASGRTWRKHPAPVLETGPRGSWDERGVADPYVVRTGDFFYLYYLGQDRARRQRLGVARSHDGVRWEKLRTNPVLELGGPREFDENGLGEPAVWQSHGAWWMLYTGRDRTEHRRLGLARSSDGVRWEKLPAVYSGSAPWMSRVTCDPSVIVEGGAIRVWFGGGNLPSPDENLNGQIGLALLEPEP